MVDTVLARGGDKLTAEFTLKLSPDVRRLMVAVADSDGVTPSEYLRSLIDADLKQRHDKYRALASIFGSASEFDQAGHGVTGWGE